MAEMKHDMSPQVLAKIGDITVSFAMLEAEIRSVVASFLQTDRQVAQIITAELSFKNLRALAISLYKQRYGEDVDFAALRGFMNRAARLEEVRNQVTHSEWVGGDASHKAVRRKTTAKESRGIHFQFREMSETELAAIASDLRALAEELFDFEIHVLQQPKATAVPVVPIIYPSGND